MLAPLRFALFLPALPFLVSCAASQAAALSPQAPGPALAQSPFMPGPLPTIPGRAKDRPAEAPGPTTPDEASLSTRLAIEGERLGHDPSVAVGDRFVIVYTAHRYRIFDKATGRQVSREADDEIEPAGDFGTLFSPLWAPLDKRGSPNLANINRFLHYAEGDPLRCDPDRPLDSRACVREFYDTRIVWDEKRRRFWVESAARNHLWVCNPHDDCVGDKWSNTQSRRFIAVAVSVSDDPRKGFHRYVLVDKYVDWPKIAVHDHYLFLGHRASREIHVFDADKLAQGNPDQGAVRLAKLVTSCRFVVPVNHHGKSTGMSFFLGLHGDDTVTPFGLVSPDPGRAAPPVVVTGPALSLGARVPIPDNNAVYQDGLLYSSWDECASGEKRCGPHRRVRVLRLPVWSGQDGSLGASMDPAGGYLNTTIEGPDADEAQGDLVDRAKPALDVNARGDMVVVYSRRGHKTSRPLPPEVRYSIVYRSEQQARASVLLRRGTTNDVPDVNNNAKAGIDLAGAQVDPTDGLTVWVTHAYADQSVRWFRQITAAIRPH